MQVQTHQMPNTSSRFQLTTSSSQTPQGASSLTTWEQPTFIDAPPPGCPSRVTTAQSHKGRTETLPMKPPPTTTRKPMYVHVGRQNAGVSPQSHDVNRGL